MKNSLFAAAFAVSITAAALPAFASVTHAPAITLLSTTGSTLAVEGKANGCNRPAQIDGTPYWEIPTVAAEQGAAGIAEVKIDLSPTGALLRESLFSSTGNGMLDRAALLSPRLTRFAPELVDCNRVGGSYLYVVEF